MKKLKLGKSTLHSIQLQIETILESAHSGEIEISKIKPKRTGTGIFLLAKYRTTADPSLPQSKFFAMFRNGGSCDIWLENPTVQRRLHKQLDREKLRFRR